VGLPVGAKIFVTLLFFISVGLFFGFFLNGPSPFFRC